jgi:LuxR family maltose regulon positive regulatory protein
VSDHDSFNLIQTKLHIPQISNELVLRSRLIERLDLGLEPNGDVEANQEFRRKLTLVTAPAGYGKTTLVASWLRSRNFPAAWITLDENDNDFLALIHTIVSAIRSHFDDACADTLELLHAVHSLPEERLTTGLINEITKIHKAFVLAIDDYHHIHDQAARNLISKLIDNQPRNLHLVLVTRTDPFLPLPRLRASGEITEIRRAELRFGDAEAEGFLRGALGFAVDREAIWALNGRAEGWIAGLQLVALSVRGQRDLQALLDKYQVQSNKFVHEYLVSEVLDQLPEAVRSFMLKTSILDRLNGSLGEVVAGVDDPECDGQAYLEWMVSANLFVIPLDERGTWFRYHHLFRALLARNLQAAYSPSEINSMHRKASQWFVSQGYFEEAIHHAITADDLDTAVALVEEQCQDLLNSQDRSTLERRLSKLPASVVLRRPVLLITKAWLLFREWRLTALEEILDAVEVQLEPKFSAEERPSLHGQLAALRSVTAYALWEDYTLCLDLAVRALGLLPVDEPGARALAFGFQALARQALGDKETSVRELESIIRSPTQIGPSRIQAFLGLALIHQLSGDLQNLSQVSGQFLTLASRKKHPNSQIGAYKVAGWLNYELNQLHEAVAYLSAVSDYRYRANFVAYFDATLNLAKTYLALNDMEKARSLVDVLRADTLHLNNTDLLEIVEAFRAYLLALQEDMFSALRWARSVDPNHLYESILVAENASLIHARILIWGGTDKEVQAIIDFLRAKLTRARTHHFALYVIRTLIHLALAYQRLGNTNKALAMLEQAFYLASPGGFIRTFIDLGRPMADILVSLGNRLPTDCQPYLKILIKNLEADKLLIPSLAGSQHLAIESITKRETEVLQLMQAGRTDREIAHALSITHGTARRHASNIYRKLSINNRQDAVRRAEMLGILSLN